MAGLGAEQARAAKLQGALYRIAELASAAEDMQEFYRAIHEVVGELMPAKNFFIALYDDQRQLINWPYHVDEEAGPIPTRTSGIRSAREAGAERRRTCSAPANHS